MFDSYCTLYKTWWTVKGQGSREKRKYDLKLLFSLTSTRAHAREAKMTNENIIHLFSVLEARRASMLLRPRQCRRRLPHDDEQTLVIIHYNAVYSIFPYYNIDIPITNYYNIFIPSPRNKNIHSIFLLVGSLSIPNSAFTATNSAWCTLPLRKVSRSNWK